MTKHRTFERNILICVLLLYVKGAVITLFFAVCPKINFHIIREKR